MWGGARLVDYLIETGANAQALKCIEEGLRLIGDSIDHENYHHRYRRDEIVRQAARIAELIPVKTIERLLVGGNEIAAQNRQARTALAARLDAPRLESMLERAGDPSAKAELLGAFRKVQPTEKMRRFLRETLAAATPFDHIALEELRHPIRAWWSDETLSAVVDAFIGANYLGMDMRHNLSDIADDVGSLITRQQYERCVAPKIKEGLPAFVTDAFAWWKELVTLVRPQQ